MACLSIANVVKSSLGPGEPLSAVLSLQIANDMIAVGLDKMMVVRWWWLSLRKQVLTEAHRTTLA